MRQRLPRSSQSGHAAHVTLRLVDGFTAAWPTTLRHHYDAELCTALVALLNLLRDGVEVIGDLRDEDNISPAGDTGCQGDPTRVPPHEFEDEHAVVAFGGGVEFVERLHRRIDCCVKAHCDLGPVEVVVNGFGHPDHAQPFLHQLLRNAHGAVAPDDQQPIDAIVPRAMEHRLRDIKDVDRPVGADFVMKRLARLVLPSIVPPGE